MSSTVAFAGVRVEVRASGEAAARVADFALRHVARADAGAGDVRLDLFEEQDALVVARGGAVLARADGPGAALDALLGHLTHHLVDPCTEPLLHAALVVRTGGALLLPAESGAGKSTLTAWLCARGAALASDELVRVAGARAEGLTRPVNLKFGSRAIADAILGGRAPGADLHLRWEGGDFLHAEALGRAPHVGACAVAALVFPRWVQGASASLRPIRAAQAARRAMEHLVDARNLDGHGLSAMVELGRTVPAFELAYGDLSEAERALDGLSAR